MRVHHWVAFATLCLVLGLFLVLGFLRPYEARANGTEEQRLLELINEYRQANGVGPLVPSEVLSTAAEHHSQDMANNDFFAHKSKESSYYPDGSSLADRVAREGYPADANAAENVARGHSTPEEVFADWRASSEHTANMLNEGYTAVGIGHAAPYWTADFGSVAEPSAPETRVLASETGMPSAEQPPDETATTEQIPPPPPGAEQTTDEQEPQVEPPPPATEPDEGVHTKIGVGQDGALWTFDFDSVDDLDPLGPETHEVNIRSETPPTEDPTTEQYGAPGELPPAEVARSSGEEVAFQMPGETVNTEQAPPPEQSIDGQAQEEATPAMDPGEEAEPRMASSAQPAEGAALNQYEIPGEDSTAQSVPPPAEEQAVREPAIETDAQEEVPAEQDLRGPMGDACPPGIVGTETAQEGTTLEDLVRQVAPAAEEPNGRMPATRRPQDDASGTSGDSTSSNTPLAIRELPRTSGAPLWPLGGGILLLAGGLAGYGIARKQKGL